MTRTHYTYEKSPDNAIFAEFRWANFFRTHLVLEQLLGCTKDCASVTLADVERDDPKALAKAGSSSCTWPVTGGPLTSGMPRLKELCRKGKRREVRQRWRRLRAWRPWLRSEAVDLRPPARRPTEHPAAQSRSARAPRKQRRESKTALAMKARMSMRKRA